MVLLGERLMWKLVLIYLEMVLILMLDRCMVCAERSIGLENQFGRS
jgi:hypothetical protein